MTAEPGKGGEMIKTKRLISGEYAILKDGEKIGRAWRWPKRSDGTIPVGFGAVLSGYYWHEGKANRQRGSTATGVRLLRDVVPLAASVVGEGK